MAKRNVVRVSIKDRSAVLGRGMSSSSGNEHVTFVVSFAAEMFIEAVTNSSSDELSTGTPLVSEHEWLSGGG